MRPCLLAVCFLLNFSFIQAADVAKDFTLRDTNPRSNRATATVSPRDYLLQVSGYYFGHAG